MEQCSGRRRRASGRSKIELHVTLSRPQISPASGYIPELWDLKYRPTPICRYPARAGERVCSAQVSFAQLSSVELLSAQPGPAQLDFARVHSQLESALP